MESEEIRQIFLNFFKDKGHLIVPSAPIVVKDDSTLMFTNAGMNQFKDIFLGVRKTDTRRVANSQKCLRVSGKHNDLEEVGVDTYHHTMFEMLGNWSFGDYFKKEAIAWAWELLTEHYKIPTDRLYATVFEGDEAHHIDFDEESYHCWRAYLPEERVLRGSKKDNFWEMGDVGPCGPCTEIHIDLRSDGERKKIKGETLVNTGHPQVIEIWNLVFIQFNRKQDQSLELLPEKHVDTGMGFERLCMVLQGKTSTYDTDVFTPLIRQVENIAGISYTGTGAPADIAVRVIADHIRAVAFAIADGQLPSNTGAGYVIRRILRRAVRYGYSYLHQHEPFLCRLVDTLVGQMGRQFPELVAAKTHIERVIEEEEKSFLKTLGKGLHKFEHYVAENKDRKIVAGSFAFELYDTYGFPIDLTQLIAKERGWKVEMDEFEKCLTAQKERSRNATRVEAGDWTELAAGESKFVGYDQLETTTRILRYRTVKIGGKEIVQVVLEQNPFYAEGGGQVGDKGVLVDYAGKTYEVTDTKKENNQHVLFLSSMPDNLSDLFTARVNEEARKMAACHHSATHLLHYALRKVLGSHVEQKGSLVEPYRLRFDFTHFQKMTAEELNAVEALVNQMIFSAYPLREQREATIEEAKQQQAVMLFGEKYGDKVRIINLGPSTELCGGTHVQNTAYIQLFKITAESAVAAGVRRIEAVASKAAYQYYQEQLNILQEIKALLKNEKQPVKALQMLLEEKYKCNKILEILASESKQHLKGALLAKRKMFSDGFIVSELIEVADPSVARNALLELKTQYPDTLFLVGFVVEQKPHLMLSIGEKLIQKKKWDAGKIIRNLAKEINGKGGGQAFFATAIGTDAGKINRSVEIIREILRHDA